MSIIGLIYTTLVPICPLLMWLKESKSIQTIDAHQALHRQLWIPGYDPVTYCSGQWNIPLMDGRQTWR